MTAGEPVGGLVDSHVHFFDRAEEPRLAWGWLDGNITKRISAPITDPSYLPDDLRAEAEPCGGLRACVHVSATSGGDPVDETAWLAVLRARHGAPAAAIVSVPLEGPDFGHTLDRHLEFDFVRGVRDLRHQVQLGGAAYVDAVAELGRRGLIFEVACGPRRFAELGTLADGCPDTVVVLEHFGFPPDDPDAVARWREGLRRLAARPNLLLKLSGAMLCVDGLDSDRVGALVGAALDAFGPARSMFGSNFPIDRSRTSLASVAAALTDGLDPETRELVLCGVASKVYGLGDGSARLA